ncbi:MAG: PAS domain S-box protein, partial [Desulfobulbaceae bacterium]|nr:PAS domain S-box protein [Desulfobulbaceae bacterium]
MTNKPTYEELEQKILELERVISECNRGGKKDRLDFAELKHVECKLHRSEERFSLAMEANKDGLWDWDINTGEVYYSPGYTAMLGYTANELPPHCDSWTFLIHPEDKELVFKVTNDCIYNRCTDFQVEFRMQAKNGDWRWILCRGKAIVRDEDRRAVRMIGTHTDITERKRTEEALQESELKYRTIFENVQETFYEVSIEGVVLDVSPSVEHLSKGQYKRLDLIGKPLFDLYADYAEREKYLEILQKQDFIRDYEVKLKNLDGSIIDCAISSRMQRDVNGRPVKIIGSLIDITDRKRAEEALEKRMIALVRPLNSPKSITFDELFNLEDIQRLQDEFSEATGVASMITHPDGTPITAPSNFRRLCSEIIRKTEVGRANCFRSDALIGKGCTEGPTIQTCLSCGLWDAGAGITVGGRHIANWLVGQVRDETQTEVNMRAYAREIGADEETVVEAFSEIPAMSHLQFQKISRVLFTLANQLSNFAFQNVQQARFISERKHAEQTLLESETRIRHIMDSTLEAIIGLDQDGIFTFINRSGIELLGYENADEFIGQNMHELIHHSNPDGSFLPASECVHLNAMKSRTSMHDSGVVFWRKDGSSFPASCRLQPIDTDDHSGGAVITFLNISEQINANMEKKRLEAQLHHYQKMEAIGTLAGGIAHDFNNILGGIIGYGEMMEMFEIESRAEMLEKVGRILQAAYRAKDLVNQILAFSRKVPVEFDTVNLIPLIKETLILLRASFPATIKIATTFTAENDTIYADPTQIHQVIINLCTNAVDSMKNKGGTLTISLSEIEGADISEALPGEQLQDSLLLLEVKDTGHGFSSDLSSRIFDPYFTTKKVGEGTGMGLALVHGIVSAHNGFISAKSQSDVGSVFRIFLPQYNPVKEAPKVETFFKASMGNSRILLVDDEENLVVMNK